jgi:hypothetical protein
VVTALRTAAIALALALAAVATAVRADGEAGVVIDTGGGTVTYCVAFEGESITGDELLRRAGRSFDQFGGAARTVCSIDELGCSDSSSFDSCFCECEAGSGSCTYWAFFIQRYGSAWQYSTLGFNLAEVRDGDMHGWRWGSGSMQSAPPPASVSFEQVCGHSPRGGQAPTPTNTPLPPTSTPVPATATLTATPPAATADAGTSPTASADATDSPTATATATRATDMETATATAASPTGMMTVTPLAGASDDESDDGSGVGTWAAFGAVAAVLGAGIAAGIAWRQRHGG